MAVVASLFDGWEVLPWARDDHDEGEGSDWEECETISALAATARPSAGELETMPTAPRSVGAKAARSQICKRNKVAAASASLGSGAPAGEGEVASASRILSRYGSSKYRGVVCWPTQKSHPWRTSMYIDGKRKLSEAGYEHEEDAARAYDELARQLGRPESQLNFPREPVAKAVLLRGVYTKVLRTKRKGGADDEGEVKVTRFTASIRVANRSKHLGTFDTEELAALAYDRVARELGRDDSQLNFPENHDYSRLAGHMGPIVGGLAPPPVPRAPAGAGVLPSRALEPAVGAAADSALAGAAPADAATPPLASGAQAQGSAVPARLGGHCSV